jgi:diadenylate cyclase
VNVVLEAVRNHWRDAVEIVILSYAFYRLFLLIQGTRAMQMLLGLIIVFMAAFASLKLGLHTINWIFSNFLAVLVMAVVILFQPEIRRALANMGRGTLFKNLYSPGQAHVLDEIVKASVFLAGKRIGALIALQRETELANYVEHGQVIDGIVSRELLTSIFLPNSPIHDGAVLIREDRVVMAAAFLPISLDPNIDRELGTRHRAAVGISEETDAVVIVVSEETGAISLITDGFVERHLDAASLRERLERYFIDRRKR